MISRFDQKKFTIAIVHTANITIPHLSVHQKIALETQLTTAVVTCYGSYAILYSKNPNGLNPFTADPVKALHFAILV